MEAADAVQVECIALVEMAVDCSLQADDGDEAAAPYALAREGREERL
jgi:hypothetical protein